MSLKIYFGAPGSGKTTHAASVVYKNLKKGWPTFANFEVKGAYRVDVATDIGKYEISHCDLIIDEAGIDYNNRNYKAMPKHQIEWFKLYRHYRVRDIYVYSQSFIDMDVTLRRLCDQIYLVKRSIIPFLMYSRRIGVKIGINQDTNQIEEQYFFVPFSRRYKFMPRYWKMFDSWAAPQLESKKWIMSGFGAIIPDKEVLQQIAKGLKGSVLYRVHLRFGKFKALFNRFVRS